MYQGKTEYENIKHNFSKTKTETKSKKSTMS